MSSEAVWLIETDSALRGVLRELYEQEGYSVLKGPALCDVWRGVLSGQTGVVVADATDLWFNGLCDGDAAEYARLSTVVPVLLLVNVSHDLSSLMHEVGRCQVLGEPFEDLDRLLLVTRELSKRMLSSPTCGAF